MILFAVKKAAATQSIWKNNKSYSGQLLTVVDRSKKNFEIQLTYFEVNRINFIKLGPNLLSSPQSCNGRLLVSLKF